MGAKNLNGKRRLGFMVDELEDLGIKVSRKATVKEVESIYRKKVNKSPPPYQQFNKFWLHSLKKGRK